MTWVVLIVENLENGSTDAMVGWSQIDAIVDDFGNAAVVVLDGQCCVNSIDCTKNTRKGWGIDPEILASGNNGVIKHSTHTSPCIVLLPTFEATLLSRNMCNQST